MVYAAPTIDTNSDGRTEIVLDHVELSTNFTILNNVSGTLESADDKPIYIGQRYLATKFGSPAGTPDAFFPILPMS